MHLQGEEEAARLGRMEDEWMLRQPRLSEFGKAHAHSANNSFPTVPTTHCLTLWVQLYTHFVA